MDPIVACPGSRVSRRVCSKALVRTLYRAWLVARSSSPSHVHCSSHSAMGADMTTLQSDHGRMDLNWKNVYRAAETSSTPALLQLLLDLARQHGVQALVNIGLVPVEGRFIDIDPLVFESLLSIRSCLANTDTAAQLLPSLAAPDCIQVWVRHLRQVSVLKAAETDAAAVEARQLVSQLLRLSLQRYASLWVAKVILTLIRHCQSLVKE